METLRSIGRSVSDAAEKVFSPKAAGEDRRAFGSDSPKSPEGPPKSAGAPIALGREPMEPTPVRYGWGREREREGGDFC